MLLKDELASYVPLDEITIFIFDFCGTIYFSNTTLDFLKFLRHTASLNYRIKHDFLWFIAKLLKDLKIIRPVDYVKIRVRSLKGLKRDYLLEQAVDFLKVFLSTRQNRQIIDFLKFLTQEGKIVIVNSYTLDLIVTPFSKKYQIREFITSKLQFDQFGIATGAYEVNLQSLGKLHSLEKLYSHKILKNSAFFTDDPIADQDIFNFVRFPFKIDEGKVISYEAK